MKYPRNKFKIHLPSLAAAEKYEKKKERGKLKKPPVKKILDSERRKDLADKIEEWKINS